MSAHLTTDGTTDGSTDDTTDGTKILDARGLQCPEPVMLLHKAMAEIAPGDCLTVHATDPTTARDIPQFCRFLSHELISQHTEDDLLVFLLRKGA